jgi:hypothetical protein
MLMKLLLLSAFILYFTGCENEYPDSIYNPSASFKPNPVITSIFPELAYAGVDTLEIAGQNFSSNPEEMAIFFNGKKGQVVSSTPTMLRAVPANITGDSIKIQLSVDGALEFASYDSYVLEPIMIQYGSFDQFDAVYGIECDREEDVYASLLGKKIEKINSNLERSIYVTNLLLDKATQILMGPEGEIYYLNGVRFLIKIEPNGGDDNLFVQLPGNAWDLDFDSELKIYAGGSGKAIYKVTPDKAVSTVSPADFPEISIKAVRVFNGYIYFAGKYSGTDANIPVAGVWRNQIIEGSETLGSTEVVFDFDANYPDFEIQSMEISENGELYLGTTAPVGIIVVQPNGSFAPLYPGVLSPDIYAMTWGNREFIYVSKKEFIEQDDGTLKELSSIARINARKNGAPHFGRF